MVLAQIVRWADNTADLKRNLAQGLDQIEAVKAGAEKMVNAFRGDKLIESAHKMTAAIGMLQRGVNELSPQEAANKLAFLERAMDKMERTGRPIPAQMRQTADALRQVSTVAVPLSARFQALGQDVLKSAAGFATGLLSVAALQQGFRILKDFVLDCAKSFLEAEKSNAKMDASLRSVGQFTPRLATQYRALAEEMQRTTIHSDDLNAQSIALFTSLGRIGPANMERALKAAADLSAGLGKDLLSSTELLAKAFQGKISTLQRYGIAVEASADKGRQFENVLAAINARFGGQAAAETQTQIGRLSQLANAWDNVKEIIGEAIVLSPKFQTFLSVTNRLLLDQAGAAAQATKNVQGLVSSYDEYLARAMQRGLPLMKPGARPDINLAPEIKPDYVLMLGKARQEIFALTDAKRRQLDAARALGDGYEELAASFGLSENATRLYGSVVKDTTQATKALNEEAEALRREQERVFGVDIINRAIGLKNAIGSIDLARLSHEMQSEVLTSVEAAIAVYQRWGDEAPRSLMQIRDALQPIVAVNTLTNNLERNLFRIQQRLLAMGNQVKASAFFPTIKTSPIDTLSLGTPVDPKQLEAPAHLAGSRVGMAFATSFKRFTSGLGQTVLDALTGGGNVARSIGALAGQAVGSSFADWFGKTLEKSGLGRMLKDILPGAGALLGGVVDWLFGPTWKEQVTAFADRVGGSMDGLRDKLRVLGAEGERMWAAITEPQKGSRRIFDTMKDIESALARVDAAQASARKQFDLLTDAAVRFGGVAPRALHGFIDKLLESTALTEDMRAALSALKEPASLDELRRAAERYGVTLDQLGQQTAQLDLSDTFDRIFSDFTLLHDAGADATSLYKAMAEQVNAALDRARRLGLAVPEFMRPMLEAMLNMGLLTDEFGKQLNDLNGFTFSASIQSTMDRLAEILERIAKAMEDAVVATAPLAGPEAPVIPPGSKRSVAGGNMTVNLEMSGQTIARATAPFLPGEVQRLRLA